MCFFCLFSEFVYAQATSATAVGITCAASGSSTQVIAATTRRYSYSLSNTSDTDVRIGFLASGTANLTDSNSFILKSAQTYADSLPNVYAGRVVCMSTSGATKVIYVTEAQR